MKCFSYLPKIQNKRQLNLASLLGTKSTKSKTGKMKNTSKKVEPTKIVQEITPATSLLKW